jgi:hypothetical protein
MMAQVADPVVKLLFAYEIAKHQLSLPVNRFGWVVEPPQSLAHYSDDRALFVGEAYSAIVRLLGSGFPVEGNEGQKIDTSLEKFTLNPETLATTEGLVKNQLVLLYLNFLGPALVDRHICDRVDSEGNVMKRANGEIMQELDIDLKALTWQGVFDLFPFIQESKESLIQRYREPPIGEPERDRAHFEQRAKAYEGVMFDEADLEEESDEDMEALRKRVIAHKVRASGKKSKSSTPRKRKDNADLDDNGTPSKRPRHSERNKNKAPRTNEEEEDAGL